jgi:hypothetical protein
MYERRQAPVCRFEQQAVIDAAVLMRQHVALADEAAPVDVGMGRAAFLRDLAGGFAEHFERAFQCAAAQPVFEEASGASFSTAMCASRAALSMSQR